MIMKDIKTVGVKTLKNNLSAYLREVKSGALILITDRGSVVAEMKQPEKENLTYEDTSLQKEWIREGRLILPRREKRRCRQTDIHVKPGTAARLLDKDREE